LRSPAVFTSSNSNGAEIKYPGREFIYQPKIEYHPMKTNINPELWNSLSPMQKREIAENLLVEEQGFFSDFGEVAAWVSTLVGAAAVIAFTTIVLR
jgi:hypothetical protein